MFLKNIKKGIKNWVYFTLSDFSFSFDFFKPELNQIHAFTTERLFSTLSW